MPTKAKLYITVIVALGFALLIGSLASSAGFTNVDQFLALAALACIASTLKVRVPGVQGSMSVGFVFLLVGAAELTLPQTLLMAGASALIQLFWRPKTRPKMIQIPFNMATLMLASGVAWETAHLVPAQPWTPIALIPAAAVLFALNSALVAVVLGLLKDQPFKAIWRHCNLWIFPYYVGGAVIAGIVGAWSQAADWRASLLMVVPLYLMYLYYSEYVDQRAQRTPVSL
jgi:hypothetical protein